MAASVQGLLSPAILAALTPQAAPQHGLLAARQPGFWDRMGDSLVGAENTGADRRGLLAQALLGAAAGMAQTGGQGFMGALGNGLASGLNQLGAGRQQLADERYRQGMLDRQTADPAGLREFTALTEGLSEEDKRKAARVRLGLDGRATSAGYGFDTFTDAMGNPRPQRTDPRSGGVEIWMDEQQRWVPLGAAQAAGIEAPSVPGVEALPNYTAANGEQVRIDPSVPAWLRQQILANPGAEAYATGPAYTPAPVPGLGRGRSKEAETAAVTAAAERTKLSLLPDEMRIRTDAAVDQAGRTAAATADAERSAAAPKRLAQYRQALTSASNVMGAVDSALGLIGPTTTGFLGARLRGIEGSDAYNLASQVETVKANLGFDRLQQMRDNSPTGGALGSVAVQELTALQSTIANLDPNQDDAQLRANLGKVKTHYRNWVAAVEQAIANEENRAPNPAPSTGTQPARRRYNPATGAIE